MPMLKNSMSSFKMRYPKARAGLGLSLAMSELYSFGAN